MAKIISISNQKGGCGKTTTAINLSSYLALAGKKTLLVDIDSQANATSGVGIDKSTIEKSSYDILMQHFDIKDVIIKTSIDKLMLLPSKIDLAGAEIELVGGMAREFRLKSALNSVRDSFDFIIIDSPPSLGLLTLNAMSAADSVIIPLQCEYYALEGLGQLVNTVELVRKNLNPNLQIEGILLTMADYRTNLTQEVMREARSYFKAQVFNAAIPRNIRLSEAPGYGKPIPLYDKDSVGAKRYEEVANELIYRNRPAAAPTYALITTTPDVAQGFSASTLLDEVSGSASGGSPAQEAPGMIECGSQVGDEIENKPAKEGASPKIDQI